MLTGTGILAELETATDLAVRTRADIEAIESVLTSAATEGDGEATPLTDKLGTYKRR